MRPSAADRILDVGGTPFNWHLIQCESHVDLLNLEESVEPTGSDKLVRIVGDGTALPFANGAYDIVFSNSVIEHVGELEKQAAFAREVLRVAPKIWLQTPARCFPFEPHLLGLFIHWLPKAWQKKLIRNFTVWGWITRAPQAYIDQFVDGTRLMNYRELVSLFPGCEIKRERFMFMTKSYLVMRNAA